ncbi:MAG: helix-turn-helix domain-containing protein [Ilumatobacteraceae bacterium]
MDDWLTLQDAAQILGVHYMTAYRYVRIGRLPADKVGGGWRVQRSDLQAFQADQAANASAASSPAPPSAASGGHGATGANRAGGADWAGRLERRLVVGDTNGAWGVLEAALAAGVGIEQCYSDVMAPALSSIGERWAQGELDVSAEHLASGTVARLMGRLGARTFRRGRSRGLVLVGAPEGERHALPVAMLADLVRYSGWEVLDLGVDMPAGSFVHAVNAAGNDLVAVGLSCTTEGSRPAVQQAVAALRTVLPSGVPIVIGGAGTEPGWLPASGADHHAASAAAFVGVLERSGPKAP